MSSGGRIALFWTLLVFFATFFATPSDAGPGGNSDTFVIHHGKGRLRLPVQDPLKPRGQLVRWKDGCGNSSRICAEASTGKDALVYLIGGTVSPTEASTPHQCEPQARKDPRTGACILESEQMLTYTRRFGATIISVSTDAAKPDHPALLAWLSQIQWEAR